MNLQQFWLKYYPEDNQQINIASNNGHPYMWMRKTAEWVYLADSNGDFRAAKANDSLLKVIVEWLNAIKAGQDRINDLKHDIIKENIEYDAVRGRWSYKGAPDRETSR
jgi:hypothetical protein